MIEPHIGDTVRQTLATWPATCSVLTWSHFRQLLRHLLRYPKCCWWYYRTISKFSRTGFSEGLDHADRVCTRFIVASDGVLSEGYGHGGLASAWRAGGGRRSTVARSARRRAAPVYAPIPDVTWVFNFRFPSRFTGLQIWFSMHFFQHVQLAANQ